MKKFLLLLLNVFLLFPSFLMSQAIPITWKYQGGNTAEAVPDTISNTSTLSLSVGDLKDNAGFDDFVKNSTIGKKGGSANSIENFLKSNSATLANFRSTHTIDIRTLNTAIIDNLQDGDVIELILKEKSEKNSFDIHMAIPQPPDETITSEAIDDELANWIDTSGKTVKLGEDEIDLSSIYNNEERYDKEANRAYLIVDENGNLYGNNPVNIDADDKIYVIMIGKFGEISKRKVDFIGSYAPVELQIRSFAPPTLVTANAFKIKGNEEIDVKVFSSSPFTSQNVTIKIKNKNGTSVLSTYSLRVNKLFHLGFGVSFNRTALADPNFVTSPLSGTTNTIVKTNDGYRNLISFNAIWYWSSTIRYLIEGSNITRGRDVLKEPNFLERINPTFGVSLNGTIADNMFAGFTFEFARGGSLVGGYHFGKVKELAIPNFKLNETVYTGSNEEIPTSSVSKQKLFFGLIIDTRIFNALFTRGQ